MTMNAEARALASPLRLRILRICLHEAHTNKEIAQVLGMNPGSTLHHVRTLADTGFLRAQEPRRGKRGAREVPYIATRRSWDTEVPGIGPILIQTFLDEVADVDPDELAIMRLGLKLDEADMHDLMRRMQELIVEFKDKPSSPDGQAVSVFVAMHPDRSA